MKRKGGSIGIKNLSSALSSFGFELQSRTRGIRKNAHTYCPVSGGAARIRSMPFMKVFHLSCFKNGDAVNEIRFTKHQRYAPIDMIFEGICVYLAITVIALDDDDFFAEKPKVFFKRVIMHSGPPKKKEGTIIRTAK